MRSHRAMCQCRNSLAFAVTLAVAGAGLRAQEIEALPTEHTLLVAPSAFVDFDTGAALPGPALQKWKADLRLDRDGSGFYAAPLLGGVVGTANAIEPAGEWSTDRIAWTSMRGDTDRHLFVRTDRGAVAKVTVTVIDPYSTASLLLHWILAPAGTAAFLPAPRELGATWADDGLALSWSGDAPNYLIEVETDGKLQKQTSAETKAKIAGLAPAGVHRVRVRGLFDGGRVTLPACVTQHGRARPPMRGEVAFAPNWYDRTGGLSLTRGEAVERDADVVFYLYGVYVPGGGVQKVGKGGEAYRALAELPERGYLPVYGRIDDHDVYAVHLADGRYAKLWIEPTDGSDVRNAMSVHFAFLADGRRRLLASPSDVTAVLTTEGARLTWPAVAGAARYRLTSASLRAPVEMPTPDVVLRALAKEHLHRVEVVAIGADGEESDAHIVDVSTYGPDYRIGRFTLRSQHAGIDLSTATEIDLLANGTAPPTLDLQFDGGAGNYNGMSFKTPFGACECGDLAYGEFPAAGQERKWDERHYSDDRKPGFERFLVRTHDGGLASVRIRVRDSTAQFDYVLKLPPKK